MVPNGLRKIGEGELDPPGFGIEFISHTLSYAPSSRSHISVCYILHDSTAEGQGAVPVRGADDSGGLLLCAQAVSRLDHAGPLQEHGYPSRDGGPSQVHVSYSQTFTEHLMKPYPCSHNASGMLTKFKSMIIFLSCYVLVRRRWREAGGTLGRQSRSYFWRDGSRFQKPPTTTPVLTLMFMCFI